MHKIRLRGPWRYEVLARIDAAGERRTDDLPLPGKQKMPADWSAKLGADFYGVVRYRRTFHQPTGIEAGQGVWLVVEEVYSRGAISLNGQSLAEARRRSAVAGGSDVVRVEIAPLLSPTNELIIDVEHSPGDEGIGGLTGEVRLEIQTVMPRPVD